MRTLALVLLLASVGTDVSHAQESQGLYEAAAFLHTKVEAANAFANLCSKRYPAMAASIAEHLQKWKTSDARAISRADSLWRSMDAQAPQPEAENTSPLVRANEILASVPEPKVNSFCSTHFKELSSGLNRKRSPEAYRLLEAAQ
jgi:hypothetical protein